MYLGLLCWPNVVQVCGKFDFFSTKLFHRNKYFVHFVLFCFVFTSTLLRDFKHKI